MIKNRILILLSFLTFSCSLEKNRTEYVKSGDDLYKVSYSSGILSAKIQVASDKKTRQGYAEFFYNTGRLKETAFFDNDTLIGSHKFFDTAGIIRLFICHDSRGDTIFMRSYSSSDSLLTERGTIMPNGIESLSDLKESQEVLYASFLVNAPHTFTTVKCYYTHNNDKDTVFPFKEEVTFDWRHYYYYKILEQGTYKYNQVTLIVDTTKQIGYRQHDAFTVDFNW